jgi:hypothetical protein
VARGGRAQTATALVGLAITARRSGRFRTAVLLAARLTKLEAMLSELSALHENVESGAGEPRAGHASRGGARASRVMPVMDEGDAQTKRFIGSPTIRIDGVDVEGSS